MPLPINALTTLANLKGDLGITVTTYDVQLERLIGAASEMIARYCRRVFERNTAIAETLPGYGWQGLLVSRAPVNEVVSVAIDGGVLTVDDYSIGDAEAGVLHREGGWEWTAHDAGDIGGAPIPGSERSMIEVVYDGGWVTPAQAVAMAGTPNLTFAAVTPATITRSAGSWITDGFVANRPVTIAGATIAANNGTFRIGSVAATVLALATGETLTTEGPTASCTAATVRGLPFDLEEACLDLARGAYLDKHRNPNVTSERLLSWNASYGTAGLPVTIARVLNSYRRIV